MASRESPRLSSGTNRRRVNYPRQRLDKVRDASSSSSLADEEQRPRSISASSAHSTDTVPRRRKRKRKSSRSNPRASYIKSKALSIEKALLNLKDDLSDDTPCEKNDGSDPSKFEGRLQLKEFAISDGGLLNDELRKKVWPRLLNIDYVMTSVPLDDEEVKGNKNYNQVLMDVNRSLKRFPPGISDEDRPELQDQLTRLIIRVLHKHPHLYYYQGYHDVAITFLLVVGEEMAFNILEKLSTGPWLRDFMEPTMEQTTYLLNFMYPLIEAEDVELCEFLEFSEVGTIFALPWLITWFGHVLPDYSDVVRLYDYFLAQPPMMPVYLAAAIVLHRSEDVLQVECDLASVHGLLARIPLDSPPFELLLQKAASLYAEYPPDTIEKDVRARMLRIKEALLKPLKGKSVMIAKSTLPTSSNRAYQAVRQIVFVVAPVFLGIVIYRFAQYQRFI